MKPQILDLFSDEANLSFSAIQKKLKIRSNKLAYHLKRLVAARILIKEGDTYALSEVSEPIIPYLSQKRAAIPVILIRLGTQRQVFLCQRNKRPYKEYLGLPGGRLLVGETIDEGAKRIMKEKHNLVIIPKTIQSLTLEHVRKNKKILYSFLLILVEVQTKMIPTLLSIKRYKKAIIKSDYRLLTDKNAPVQIKTMYSTD